MLWLASLIGIVGAGAASFVLPHSQVDDETSDQDNEDISPEDGFEGTDDLFSFVEDDDQVPDEESSPFYLHQDFMTQDFAASVDPEASEPDSISDDPFASLFEEDSPEHEMDVAQAAPVALGDWVMEGPPAEVVEYEAETESLMLVWDDLANGAHEPDVRVEQDPDNSDVRHVVMNDYSVAEVHGDPNLSTEDVTVIPLSSALIIGLEPA